MWSYCSNIPEFSKYIQKLPSLEKKAIANGQVDEEKHKSAGSSTRSSPIDKNV